MKILLPGLIVLLFMTGCSVDNEEGYSGDPEATVVAFTISNDLDIDKSVVLFFRNIPGADTLVYQTVVSGPTDQEPTLTFRVPAGSFRMILLGNGDTVHIRYQDNIRTAQNMIVEYKDGVQPPDLFYGVVNINSGEVSKHIAGLLMLNVRVTLTVKQVPSDVKKIVARLNNTGTGMRLGNLTVLNEVANIADSLDNAVPGSSPVFEFSSFLTVTSLGNSSVDVFCYNEANELIYSGSSVPFTMGGTEAVRVSCSFATNANSLNSHPGEREAQSGFYLYPRINR